MRVLECGCTLGRERCRDCRPGLHLDQERAIVMTLCDHVPMKAALDDEIGCIRCGRWLGKAN